MASTGPHIFVNVPKTGHSAVVDRGKNAVTATWPLTEATSNFPMSLDEVDHRLFVGCRSPAKVLIYDYPAGRLVGSITISRDTDDWFYDARNKFLYVSCGAGVIEVIMKTDQGNYATAKTIATVAGARISLLVPELNLFCLAVPR